MAGFHRLARMLRLLRRKASGAATEVRYAHRKTIGEEEWSQPIRAMTYTVLDCEMTGLDPGRDEILSIGAVKIRDNRVETSERFYQVFRPTEAVSPEEVILLHGLGPDEVSRGMPLADALDRLLAFVGDTVLVGHFTQIDLGFLNAALTAHRRRALRNPALDTQLLYEWACRQARRRARDSRLENIVVELGLPRFPPHHAYYDALTTALVFLKLLGDFQRAGAVQFRALYDEAGVY